MSSSSALQRFLRYVTIETASKPDCESVPSTECQFDLANLLVAELRELGLNDASIDAHCYVTATLPANLENVVVDEQNAASGGQSAVADGTSIVADGTNTVANGTNIGAKAIPVIGFLAHLDTSPDVSGKNVTPQVVRHTSGAIVLSHGVVIEEDEALRRCRGHEIVTSDGSTLLGADDKAGIAAIMAAVERLIREQKPHGVIRIGFTPDEEVGNGTAYFDIEKFGAQYAYTVDGEIPGELNKETFTAKSAVLKIIGQEIHPGSAKDVMVNATRIAAEFIAETPRRQSPEKTEKYEPYLHPYSVSGNVGEAVVRMLLRSFNDADMKRLEATVRDIIAELEIVFPDATFELTVAKQYRNMNEKLVACPEVLTKLEEAAHRAGVVPVWKPVRGGTDGSRLTEMGLPTPNIYTGGHNFHSRTEWLSVDHLETTVETLVQLAVGFAE
ncbi:MAG: peptidase T [Planctomycetaceae bacterium]|jgi:tripeptide aminopeptidase|nr:peptidase T [Planctomycetaceae bacterium]